MQFSQELSDEAFTNLGEAGTRTIIREPRLVALFRNRLSLLALEFAP